MRSGLTETGLDSIGETYTPGIADVPVDTGSLRIGSTETVLTETGPVEVGGTEMGFTNIGFITGCV